MKLVIIGAGGYGKTVYDLAIQSNKYTDVFFLDDNSKESNVKGICSDYINFNSNEFEFYPAFGNNVNRLNWVNKLEKDKYSIATIIHNSAFVSPSVKVGVGSVVLPKAVVNTDVKIGKGCIINCGAIIDHGCIIEDGVHICLGAIVKGENRIASKIKIEAGEIIQLRTYAL